MKYIHSRLMKHIMTSYFKMLGCITIIVCSWEISIWVPMHKVIISLVEKSTNRPLHKNNCWLVFGCRFTRCIKTKHSSFATMPVLLKKLNLQTQIKTYYYGSLRPIRFIKPFYRENSHHYKTAWIYIMVLSVCWDWFFTRLSAVQLLGFNGMK